MPTLLSLRGAPVAGLPGLRAEFAFRDPAGLERRSVLLGGRAEDDWYWLAFEAAALHYSDRGLPRFEEVAATFRASPRRAADASRDASEVP